MSTAGTRTADPGRRREHRAWYAYDAGASAFNTSVITVFAGPYITGMAEVAADGADTVSLLGLQVATGSVFLYGVSVSVMCQVLVLPLVGAVADRSPNKPRLLGLFSAIGVAATIALALTSGGAWLAAGLALLVGNVAFGAAAVVYDSFLPEIALRAERAAAPGLSVTRFAPPEPSRRIVLVRRPGGDAARWFDDLGDVLRAAGESMLAEVRAAV